MNLIVTLVVAIVLGLVLSNLRTAMLVVTVVWAVLLPPVANQILLDEQLDKRSMGNTVSFFVVNYVGLAIALGVVYLIHRARSRRAQGAESASPS